jgi:hypothetical protein
MKKILFLITAFICGTISLKASFAENPAAEFFASESSETPEGLKKAQQKLYEAKQKVDEINEAKQLGEKNKPQAQIKKLLKELTKIALEFFYESCRESIPFLDQKTRKTQFNALVDVVKDQINNKEYDNAYEYSKKIYDQILKLPDCLNQLKHDGKKTPSKECLTELNRLIFELDKHLYVENSPYSMMSVISPFKGEITPDDFESPSADALSNKFERFLIESGLSKEAQSSNNQAHLNNVQTNLSELFTIVSSSPVQSEGASVENNRRKKQFNKILSNFIDKEKQLMQNNHELEEKIVHLEGLFKKVKTQLKISKFEHEKSSQSKNQTIINLQTDCENLEAQLKKLKNQFKNYQPLFFKEISKKEISKLNSIIKEQKSTIKEQLLETNEQLIAIEELLLKIEELLLEIKENKSTIRKLFAENEKQAATIVDQNSTIKNKDSTIKERDSTIAKQNSTITKKNTVIAVFNFRKLWLNSTIKKQAAENKKQAATIAEQNSTIADQNSTIEEQKAKIKEQDSTIKDKDSTIAEQNSTIEELLLEIEKLLLEIEENKSKIKEQAAKITDQKSAIALFNFRELWLNFTIKEQNFTIKKQASENEEQKSTIKDKDLTIADQNSTIEEQKAKIKALEFKELWLKRVAGGIAAIAAGWLCIKYVPSSINSFTQGFGSFWRRCATRTRSYIKS